MKVLIIEDETPAITRLRHMINLFLPEAEVLESADSIESGVKWLHANPNPDLIFCDIQLADGESFEIFEHVQVKSPIIFTTAYDQYAIKAFKLNSIDYLLKPINPEEFAKAIDKFKNHQNSQIIELQQIRELLQPHRGNYKSRFLVKIGEKIQSVVTGDISFFFSQEKITFLQVFDGKRYIIDYTLDQLEGMVDRDFFFRLNRKYLVSFPSIKEIHTYSGSRLKIKLINSEDNDILVSREKVGLFKQWLDR